MREKERVFTYSNIRSIISSLLYLLKVASDLYFSDGRFRFASAGPVLPASVCLAEASTLD